jgi:hypothetical protein
LLLLLLSLSLLHFVVLGGHKGTHTGVIYTLCYITFNHSFHTFGCFGGHEVQYMI